MLDRLLQVQDDPKLPDDSGEVPKPHEVVGGLIPGHGIVSLLDKNDLGGQAFHVFRKTKKTNQKNRIGYYRIPYLKLYSCNATKLNAFLSYALANFLILNTLLPL